MKHSWVLGGLYDLYALESCFKWFRPRFLWKECGTEWKAVGRLMRVGDPPCHHFSTKRMGLSRPRTMWRKTKSTPMPLIERQAVGCPRTDRNGRDRNDGIIDKCPSLWLQCYLFLWKCNGLRWKLSERYYLKVLAWSNFHKIGIFCKLLPWVQSK